MFCPKCSQEQSSDEMRFCPRCGFALAGVAMLMNSEGVVPQLSGPIVQMPASSRKEVMIESGIFTGIAWAVLIVTTLWFDYGGPLESVAKVAALIFFILGLIGLLRFLYGFLFVKDVMATAAVNDVSTAASQAVMAEAPHRAWLSAQREFPATAYANRANTKEMRPQPSVTEHTTRLLDEPPTEVTD